MNDIAFKAYLAGVADSDGSFSIGPIHKDRPTPCYRVMFQLSWAQTTDSQKFMDILVAKYGGSYALFEPKKFGSLTKRPILKYCISTRLVVALIEDILPFLILKRRQARNILRLRKFTKNYGAGRKKPKKLLDFEHKMYLLNNSLNTKNKKAAA